MANSSSVGQLYKTVVDDVINNVKEAFLDDGVDDQVLAELKQLWETKLQASRALDAPPEQDMLIPKSASIFLPHQTQVAQGAATVQQIPVPIQIAGAAGQDMNAAATATLALPQGLYQQHITALSAAGNTIQLHPTGNGQYIQVLNPIQTQGGATIATSLPHQTIVQNAPLTTQSLQGMQGLQGIQLAPGQQIRTTQNPNGHGMVQLDGAGDTSSSDDEEYNDNDDDDDDENENNDEEEQGEEEEPLNSGDDVSEQDPDELFDTDNVVVCQYDKINRNKNKWKFHLKDGIMNLKGRDFVFQKATGDAEW